MDFFLFIVPYIIIFQKLNKIKNKKKKKKIILTIQKFLKTQIIVWNFWLNRILFQSFWYNLIIWEVRRSFFLLLISIWKNFQIVFKVFHASWNWSKKNKLKNKFFYFLLIITFFLIIHSWNFFFFFSTNKKKKCRKR